MVIFVKPDGSTIVSNDPVGLGSRVGWIEVVSPSRVGAFVELLMELPSGLAIPPEVCSAMPGIAEESVGVYLCTPSKSVTSVAGRVSYQVRFTYSDGQIEITPRGSFVVQKGVIVIPPEIIDGDSYEEIKAMIATINANYTELLEKIGEIEIPHVTNEDNGKFLRVVDGSWAAVALKRAEEVSV